MKIAIVAPSPMPFAPGGAEAVWAGLFREIHGATEHDVELIKVPVRETTLPEVMAAYQAFAALDLSHFDMVISGKYPAWIVRHPRHVVYMLHPLRGLYDTYALFGRPLTESSAEPAVSRLLGTAERLTERDVPELFAHWRDLLAELGADHPVLAFPGPLARTLVHALDTVALAPDAISRHLAISRTVAQRPGYFPAGVQVDVVHPPSDLSGLHELPGEYFFTASRHDAPKRLDLLIEGMRFYKGSRRLVIAGDGPESPRLRALAAEDPRVELVGRLSPGELVDHYARAIGVPFIPLDEDLGLITYEAMSSGKPVLTARDSGGPTEFVVPGVNGVIVEPAPAAIGLGLMRLERLAGSGWVPEAARRAMRGTTWAHVAEELLRPRKPAPRPVVTRSGSRPRLVVTSTFPIWPPRGGGQLRAYHLYGALTDRFDIELVCLAAPSAPASTNEIRPGMVERVVPRTESHDTQELEISREAGMPVTDIVAGRLTALTPDYATVLGEAVRGAAGVLLADPFLHPVVRQVAPDLVTVYDAYNCEYVLKSQLLPDTPLGRQLAEEVRGTEGAACAESVLVISVSDEDRQNLRALYGTPGERFVLVPNGVDLPAVPFTPMSIRKRNRQRWLASLHARGAGRGVSALAGFVGSWHPPNNDAARWIVQHAADLPDVGFVLLGSHTAALRRHVVPPNVFLMGVVSDAVKSVVLSSIDVALAPLTGGSGTNLKVVEYLASGAPVVSTAVGLRGLHLPPGCARQAPMETFPAAIRQELADTGSAADRTVRARHAVERRYDWGAIGRRLAPRLEEALGVTRRRG